MMTDLLTPDPEIQGIIDLVSNTTDAYTTALFLHDPSKDGLILYSWQSLSRNINEDVVIRPGEGLVGWVFKNNEPVNIDQFDRDTRQLLFYKVDESIKSFMAVPLKGAGGVLVVDSKQRYVFTDKSHKILYQFGQFLEMGLKRVFGSADSADTTVQSDFLVGMEPLLGRRIDSPADLEKVLHLIREFAGARLCCLTEALPGRPDHYLLLGYQGDPVPKLKEKVLPRASGLAGWIFQREQSLVLDREKTDSDKSFIFKPRDGLSKLPSFAGFPVFWQGRLRGALILASDKPMKLGQDRTAALTLAAGRLGAILEMDRLYRRVAELVKLDPQVGLPHRTYFTERLERTLKLSSVQKQPACLLLLRFLGLDQVALNLGQEAALEALRGASGMLMAECRDDYELGHLSYGIIGVALTGAGPEEADRIVTTLTEQLADHPLASTRGRISLSVAAARADYPGEGQTAETLIEACLKKLG
jgi:GAF domain-containing protein